MSKKIISLILCLLLIGCQKQSQPVSKETNVVKETNNTWCVYWDVSDDMKQKMKDINTVCYFGAYYQENELFIPDNILQFYRETKSMSKNQYITVVNDVVNKNSTSLKEEAIVKEKMTTEHIEELVALVKDNGFDGLELDYENFNDNVSLWKQYTAFIEQLQLALKKENKGLRVLLEAKSPIDKITLPTGPTYVMMCYNLYGGFSKPGPKADAAFLKKIKQKTKDIKNIEYALAVGGFDWSNGEATSVTVVQAKQIANTYQAKITQDKSGAWYFTYQKDGNTHTVWYSDEKTIMGWKDILGVSTVSIWKMEGNTFNE